MESNTSGNGTPVATMDEDAGASKSHRETPDERRDRLAREVGERYNADVILCSGEMGHETADAIIHLSKSSRRRQNVVLMLTTRGGSADAAYRICRSLQTHYDRFTLYIYGMCKSAGTLVALGADEIILSDYGEMGPLDVQLGKKDELFESTSGLDITQALNSANERTYQFFREVLVDVRSGTRGQLSTKLAAEIATNLAIGAYGHIYSQIDPVQLGSTERAMRVAVHYGKQLARNNLRKGTVEQLAAGYPSHSFVIDLEEAKTLFREVRAPTQNEEELGSCLAFVTRDEAGESIVHLLNEETPQAENTDDPDARATGQGDTQERAGGGEDNKTVSAAIVPPLRARYVPRTSR